VRLDQRVRLQLHAAAAAATDEDRAQLGREISFIQWWNAVAMAAADRDPRRRGYGRSRGAAPARHEKEADP
jgi:hypothetical protein